MIYVYVFASPSTKVLQVKKVIKQYSKIMAEIKFKIPLHVRTYYTSRPFRQRNFNSHPFFVFYFGCRNVPIRKENNMFVPESEITK